MGGLPKFLREGPLDDLRSIAKGMQVLPELARILAEIDVRVQSLDDEVKKMRQAVEAMGGDVSDLPPKIEDLSNTLRPMRRMGRRFGKSDPEAGDAADET